MYVQHFNLSTEPFSIAPNPRCLYLSPQHREALAHLIYGIGAGGGFVALTGEVGTGKTTLCRCLLEQLPADVDIALIFNPRLNARELLASICDELGIPHPEHRASIKLLIDRLNQHLLAAHARGRRTVVLIDEAQNLSHDVLEQIRLLTNLETNEFKLLQIILVGQPELKQLLERPNLRQLSQRITARYHLRPLSFREMRAYIDHRIAVSGGKGGLFSPLALLAIYRLSGGIPRLINLICDRALLGAYALGKKGVSWRIVRKSAREVLPSPKGVSLRLAGVGVGSVMLGIAGLIYFGWIPANFTDWGKRALAELRSESRERLANPPAEKDDPLPPSSSAASAVAGSAEIPPPEAVAEVSVEPSIPPAEASAVVSASPSSEPTPAKLGDFIASPAYTRGAALSKLFALWHLPPPAPGVEECGAARQEGLRCLIFQGSWPQLAKLDHPAVLALVLADGSKRYAALTRIRENRLELAGIDSDDQSFEPGAVAEFWQGEAILLWKPPVNSTASLHPGDRAAGVKWLRQRLSQTDAAGPADLFDAKLKTSVMAFQREQGLPPDGLVGPLTMIHLMRPTRGAAAARPGPTLH
ncbi:ExeA family protein [Methylococcus sp. EFPC2]|uniref:ExeA family protein n=1 Tax=Methylococcus sp. EFPC2 TaxID=2812648 RepID=UPI00196813DE|nr:AAA family ATPase [Methylococcus sp. EFPC2]QSA96905.1 AAA family ATPase [Methylococcus sp. EFPC2]